MYSGRLFSIISLGDCVRDARSARFASLQGRATVEVYGNYDTLMFLGNVLLLHDLCTLTSVIEQTKYPRSY